MLTGRPPNRQGLPAPHARAHLLARSAQLPQLSDFCLQTPSQLHPAHGPTAQHPSQGFQSTSLHKAWPCCRSLPPSSRQGGRHGRFRPAAASERPAEPAGRLQPAAAGIRAGRPGPVSWPAGRAAPGVCRAAPGWPPLSARNPDCLGGLQKRRNLPRLMNPCLKPGLPSPAHPSTGAHLPAPALHVQRSGFRV